MDPRLASIVNRIYADDPEIAQGVIRGDPECLEEFRQDYMRELMMRQGGGGGMGEDMDGGMGGGGTEDVEVMVAGAAAVAVVVVVVAAAPWRR